MRVLLSVVVLFAIAAVTMATNSVSTQCDRPCKTSGAKVLFWGNTPARMGGIDIVTWLNQNIPTATFDRVDPSANLLTPAVLASYDLLVLSELTRPATAPEAAALATWVNTQNGFFFGMSGWDNNANEVSYSNTYLALLNGSPSYICVNPGGGCVVSGCSSFYPSPLLAGIATCDIDFVGGYASVYPVQISGNYDYSYMIQNPQGYNLGLSVDLCNANNTGGGRYVLWGDEWISYVPRFNVEAGDEQIWFNIMNYLGVCTPHTGCNSDADCPQTCPPSTCTNGQCGQCSALACGTKTVSTSCTQETFTFSGTSATLAFDSTITSC